jgi:hypothetical protein
METIGQTGKLERVRDALESLGLVGFWSFQLGQLLEDLDLRLSLGSWTYAERDESQRIEVYNRTAMEKRKRTSVGVISPSIDERLKMRSVSDLGLVLLALVLDSVGLGGVELSKVSFVAVRNVKEGWTRG